MTQPTRQIPDDASELLLSCMIRDRFRISKSLKGRAPRGQLLRIVEQSLKLAEARKASLPVPTFPEALPVSQKVEQIKRAIAEHQVVIIAGETGSGKTTQIPKICLTLGRGVHGVIGHTQPRRVAARTVAHRIAEELNVKPGESVGYQVRFTDRTGEGTHIKVMTDGILLAETRQDRFLNQYDTLIIDEAHERSLNIDFLLGYLKRLLPQRPDLKVIITSATIDVERFSRHFFNAPVIEVSGRTFPVNVHYRPLTDFVDSASDEDSDQLMYHGVLETLKEIQQLEQKQKSPGDVLVFLAGEREIRELAHLIRKASLPNVEVLPLYSRLGVAEQNRVFQRHTNQRIVLATNVAETSLTVPGVRYVIDPGFARISRYSLRSKVQQLPIEPISQASANQRKGRCGRISEGTCFRLFSEEDFASRPEFTSPEILRTNLASVILQMLNLRLGAIEKFPFLERPEQRQINDGYQLLTELQAVNRKKEITRLGKDMAGLPIDLRLARMVMEAGQRGCLREVLTIVSSLAVQDPRERPYEAQQAADEKHRQYWHQQSDFMALLKLWSTTEEQRQSLNNNQFRKYCRSQFVSYLRYMEWRENHRQLHLMCVDIGLKENTTEADYASIHISLLSGLLGNIAEKHNDNEYLGARNRRHFIFPGSSQFKRKPRWMVSAELVETTRLFARMVAEIDNEWIEPLAQHLVKRTYHEPHFDPKRGQVLVYEEVMLYGLVIVKRRKVDFGTVDPGKARHLFIQSGLVERQVKTNAAYFIANGQLLADIETLESKSRKRDILVDSQTIYQFYDERLPESVVSLYDLDAWRKEAERSQPKCLYLSREFLMKQASDLSIQAFPDEIEVANTVLHLDYHFDPQHEHDGVSLKVPVALLRQVPAEQLDWVIPGLLEEKCLALIKALPKAQRKHFIPAPDFAKRVARDLEYNGRPLTVALAEKLFRLTGHRVPHQDFDTNSIDPHLRMNIKVLADDGKVLASGRQFSALVSQFAEATEQGFRQRAAHELEQQGLTNWTFGVLPEQVPVEQAGISMTGYPALVDKGDSVSIEILDNPVVAKSVGAEGLLKLLMLQLPDQQKYVRKNIPGFERIALYYATRGNRDRLLNDLVAAVFRYTFLEGKAPVQDSNEFQARLAGKTGLMKVANEMAAILEEVFKRANQVEDQLKSGYERQHPEFAADVRDQLHLLIGEGFLVRTPYHWLKQLPRYLKAVEYRIDKVKSNPGKDSEAQGVVKLFRDRLDPDQLSDPTIEKFRWMIEELRVSLFAQPLGTSLPVSPKRMEKAWQQVTQNG